jgi:hypothetical protein
MGQTPPEYEQPPLSYSATAPSNRVDAVQQQLDAGEWRLDGTNETVGVRRCLEAFGVPPESQVLVFSKTSLQRQRIDPQHPRALYFADDCYLGWVPGGLIESALTDPHVGLAFYRIDPRLTSPAPRFERDGDCLTCHAGPLTSGWPGLIVRSVYPDAQGEPITSAGSFLIGHESPLAQRWGGWYVTGRHGTARHLGNAIARERGQGAELDREPGANLESLGTLLSTERYLQPTSDLVALLVLEHQVGMHNRLVRGALRARKWLHYQQALQRELGEPVSAEPVGSAQRVIEAEAARIVECLMFTDEAPLPAGGVRGSPQFQAAFRGNRRPDQQGRSLKDFDLATRLFQFRCSYMIYSRAFDNLPAPLRDSVSRRLGAGLAEPAPPKPFDRLPAAEREGIRQILIATKPELARVWTAPAAK